MSRHLRAEHCGKILSIILDRPAQKNSLSIELLSQLSGALCEQVTDATAAVIVSGANGCFSAGADFADLTGTVEDLAVDDAIAGAVRAIQQVPVPVVAAVDGPCIGAAVDLCLACDVRAASRSAYFQIPATRLGLLYNPAAVARLARVTLPDTLFRLLVLGERLSAEEALRAGLLSYELSDGASLEAVMVRIQASSENIPRAVAASKSLLYSLNAGEYDPDHWHEVRKQILSSPERRAAVERMKKKQAGTNREGGTR